MTLEGFKKQIKLRLEKLEEAKAELAERKEIMDSVIENDATITDLKDQIKDLNHKLKLEKEALLNEPENRNLLLEIKDNKQGIQEIKELLSAELLNFFKESGELEFEDSEGKIRRVKFSAKIIKSNQPNLFGGSENAN